MQVDEAALPEHGPTRGSRRRWLVLGTVAVAVALVAFGLTRAAPGPDREPFEVSVASLDGERTLTAATYAGTPLVVNFFASWCTFCIAEMPDFEKVHASLDGDVAFLGIAQRDARSLAQRLVDATGVTYDVAEDPRGAAFDALGARGMPTTIFVRADGTIAERFTGPMTADALRDRIREHFSV